MEISLFKMWKFEDKAFGFSVLEFWPENQHDERFDWSYALLGFSWMPDENLLHIDFLWKVFEINFKQKQ